METTVTVIRMKIAKSIIIFHSMSRVTEVRRNFLSVPI